MEVCGSRAVVTGGAAGIGLEICKLLVQQGVASLVVLDVSQKALDTAVEMLQGLCSGDKPSIRGYTVDVCQYEQVRTRALVSLGCLSERARTGWTFFCAGQARHCKGTWTNRLDVCQCRYRALWCVNLARALQLSHQ